ncbi:hypothetical protein Y032_0012g1749 [Ancylostoma ceylanicum]|uniref:Uncharacterized protein n=1 Tax=Ancylostoma ceylanicum TaxID=53326 RepID=A0A016VD38_9BILA|nr:hypothetical protein Y032_0012g1749 [Ancylostoma ceylanicum]
MDGLCSYVYWIANWINFNGNGYIRYAFPPAAKYIGSALSDFDGTLQGPNDLTEPENIRLLQNRCRILTVGL